MIFNILSYLTIPFIIFFIIYVLKRLSTQEIKMNKITEKMAGQNKTIDNQNKTIDNQNKTIERLNQSKEEQNKTIEEQNQTIERLNQTIGGLNQSKEEQNKTIEEQNQKIEKIYNILPQFVKGDNGEKNKDINLINNKGTNILKDIEDGIKLLKEDIKELKEELRHADLNIYLLQNYTKKIELKSNMNYELLNKKYEYIAYIYKLLLTRKISNQILEIIFDENNKNKYMKTEHIFEDSNKQKFPIIIAKEDINKIPKNKINQIIDFLMFLKEKCSNIIHFSDKSSVFQIDLLTELLSGKISKINPTEKSYLSKAQALSILFDDLNASQENISIINLSDNDKEKIILNQLKEELNKIKMEKLNEDIKNNEIGLLSNENHSEETLENTIQSQNNNGNNVFNTIKDILYPNKDQKESILDKIEKSMELLSSIELTENNCENLNVKLNDENKKLNYDIRFLFSEWKNSFNKGYRADKIFKKLIKIEKDITLESIKKNLTDLVSNSKIEIFKEDYHNFAKKISSVLGDNEIDNYSK